MRQWYFIYMPIVGVVLLVGRAICLFNQHQVRLFIIIYYFFWYILPKTSWRETQCRQFKNAKFSIKHSSPLRASGGILLVGMGPM